MNHFEDKAGEGSITSPRSVEISIYEDRHGNHRIVVRKGGQRTIKIVPQEKRAPFTDARTMDSLRDSLRGEP